MPLRHLILRSLTYYWRTNAAVVAGVAVAVAVLAGALLVGDYLSGSQRDLVLDRLGRTDQVVVSAGFFREALLDDIQAAPAFDAAFTGAAPLVVAQGFVTAQESGQRAGQVRVYGVDDRFWRFHGVAGVSGPGDRDAFVNQALAAQIGAEPGTSILVRLQRPTDIPIESVFGRKDDLGRTVRLDVAAVLPPSSLGDFSLEAQQGDVRTVFVPLSRLQETIEVGRRVNAILAATLPGEDASAAGVLEDLVRASADVDDLGLTLRTLDEPGAIAVGSDTGLLTDAQVSAVEGALDGSAPNSNTLNGGTTFQRQPLLTYLANTLRSGDREVPYSLVTAIDLAAIDPSWSDERAGQADAVPPILLNEWAAFELGAAAGDPLTLEYYAWVEPGQLVTRTSEFRVAGVVPIAAGDRDLAPSYPGISDSPSLVDWDPPFPIDLRRVRPVDEAYWEQYRTTPKAFVPLDVGQRLWQSRYGAVSSIRLRPQAGEPLGPAADGLAARLRERLDPLAMGMAVRDARAEGLAASTGATDFGEYFVYFSFFLVVSALLLAVLFFKLGIEQRIREVGLLRAVGFSPPLVRRLFMGEGLLLAAAGSLLGVLGAIGYASLLMYGLRTWWMDAVGTTALTLHVSPLSLAAGAVGGIVASAACIWWTLRSLARVSERSLLMGQLEGDQADLKVRLYEGRRGRLHLAAAALAVIGVALLMASSAGWLAAAGGFFGAGAAFLVASLCFFAALLRKPSAGGLTGHGWRPVSSLGVRNATYRPGRSVLSMAVIAAATFILISVDAFRRDGVTATGRESGVGGYTLMVETLVPVVQDPNTTEGRDALNLFALDSATIEPFRLLPGDDASCLNLYAPRNPRILAPRDSFLEEGRFVFQDSLAETDAERANPWLLLRRGEPDGAIPVIADANSMTYVLHRALGEEIVITRGDRDIRLRLVAALRDSIFQGELLMAQDHFRALFPAQEGYQFMLVETDPARAVDVAAEMEDALADFGADATSTAARLAEFHRVENTYLSTFQTLGGLGLLLGTIGLATVVLRNVLERRRELALLGAVGYRKRHFLLMVAAENTLLLAGGLVAGALCAGLAIAPAIIERGGRIPLTSGGALLLFAVFVTGLLSSVVATRAATRGPLLESLRSE